MKYKKWLKRIGVLTATVITLISQTGIIATAAEIPIQSEDLTVTQVTKVDANNDNANDVTSTSKNIKAILNSSIVLKLKDTNSTDEYMALTLPKGITYSQEATKILNAARKDLELAYDSKDNTIYAKWTKDSNKDVNVSVIATKTGNYNLQAHTKRNAREVKSSVTKVNVTNNQVKNTSEDSSVSSNTATDDSSDSDTSSVVKKNIVPTAGSDELDIDDTLSNGTALPAPPSSNVNIVDYFNIPSGLSSYPSSKYSNAAIITDDRPSLGGTIWSKGQLDLSKDFSTKMNIYMNHDRTTRSADGIAFVLQNDPSGVSAVGKPGSGLGVYADTADGRITNALAVELDSYVNPSEFDRENGNAKITQQHVGVMTTNSDDITNGEMYHHNTQIDTSIGSTNAWVPFRVSWDAQKQNLIYEYGNNAQKIYHVADLNATFGGTKVYFGYTGSTGGYQEHQYVSFDTLPQSSTVTVHYKDVDTGENIDDDVTMSGAVGGSYTTEQKDFSSKHYKYVKAEGDTSGQYTSDDQEVTYYYQKIEPGDVTVHYKDVDTGATIAPDETLSGDYDETWTSEFKDLTGDDYYWQKTDGDGTLDSKKVNASGTFTENKQEVTYWYNSLDTDEDAKMLKNAYKFNDATGKWEKWNGQEVKRGDKIQWRNSFTNLSYPNGILTNVSFDDPLPSYVNDATNVKVTESDDMGEDILPDDINISTDNHSVHVDGFADMDEQNHYSVTFETTVTQDAPVGVITNTSTANTETVAGEKISASDSADIYVVDPVGNLETEKSVTKADGSSAADVRIGDELEYTIKTSNTVADSRVNNVIVTDDMPTGLTLEPGTVQVLDKDGNDITSKVTNDSTDSKLDIKTLTDLMGNESVTVKFKAKINSDAEIGKSITNVAKTTGESPNTTDSDPSGAGTDSTPTPNYNDPKPEVKKSVEDLTNGNDLDKVRVGDDLQYTIDTTNTAENSIWKDVVVSDQIPSGLDLDETSVKAYDNDGNEITGITVSYVNGKLVVSGLGDLKYNEHIKVVFTAKVNEKAVGESITNIADASGTNPDGSTTGGAGTDSTPTPNYNDPKPEVKKSVEDLTNGNDLDKVRVGDNLQYTIDTTNTAENSIWKDVVVSDQIPSGLNLDETSVKAYDNDGNETTGITVNYVNGKLVVSGLGDLKYNEHIKVVFTAKVNEKAVGESITNIADASGTNPDGSTTGGEGTDSTPTPNYNDPKPEAKKSVEDLTNGNDLDKVRVGDDLQYTIDTTNTAENSIWKDVVVSDNIPSGLDLDQTSVKAYDNDGNEITGITVSYQNGKLVVSGLGDLKYNEHIKIVFTAKVNEDAVGESITNIANATGTNPDGSTTGGAGTDSTPTPNYHVGDLETTKSVTKADGSSAADVRIGDELEYTITTTNTISNSKVDNVVVTDDIPTGLTLETGTIQVFDNEGNDITSQVTNNSTTTKLDIATLIDLLGNESVTVKFKAKVNDDAEIGKSITNVANVSGESPNETDSDPSGAGTDSTPTPNYNDPKPEVKKSVEDLTNGNDLDKVRVGDDLQYTIDTTNTAENSIWKDVVVSDQIPSGLDLDQTSVKAYDNDGNEISGITVSYQNGKLVVSGLGDLKYNEHIKVVFTAKVNEDAVGNSITNIANASGTNPDGSTTDGNGTDSTPNVEKPSEPITPPNNDSDSAPTPNHSSNKNDNNTRHDSQRKLPQTGESKDLLSLIGLIILVIVGIIVYRRRKNS